MSAQRLAHAVLPAFLMYALIGVADVVFLPRKSQEEGTDGS